MAICDMTWNLVRNSMTRFGSMPAHDGWLSMILAARARLSRSRVTWRLACKAACGSLWESQCLDAFAGIVDAYLDG